MEDLTALGVTPTGLSFANKMWTAGMLDIILFDLYIYLFTIQLLQIQSRPRQFESDLMHINLKQAKLGVPHSRKQVELGLILQSGTSQILRIQDRAKVFKAQN